MNGLVDNQAVVHSWKRQGGKSTSLNRAIKEVIFHHYEVECFFHLAYISTSKNDAEAPSRRLTTLDCRLHPDVWERVQQEFSGRKGHTCDLMALDSNAMTNQQGVPLLHSPHHIRRRNPVV